MAEANLDPVFQIQRVYLKDVSLEQPNSPEILLNQEQPAWTSSWAWVPPPWPKACLKSP
jgi:preprotein translocase subunit SecB